MGLKAVLALMLMAQAPDQAITARIAELRESPVSLVGLPCGDDTKKLLAATPKDEKPAQLESKTFACEKDCTVGVRVKNGQRVASIKVATAMVHERGRVTSAVGPALVPGQLPACKGETFVVAVMPRIEWPVTEAIVYVSEVRFLDGTTWHASTKDVQETAFKKWMVQPKNGQ